MLHTLFLYSLQNPITLVAHLNLELVELATWLMATMLDSRGLENLCLPPLLVSDQPHSLRE